MKLTPEERRWLLAQGPPIATFTRIMDAAEGYRGVNLSWREVMALSVDRAVEGAIATALEERNKEESRP